MNDYKMKKESSVIRRHCVEKHVNKEQESKFKVRQVLGKTQLLDKLQKLWISEEKEIQIIKWKGDIQIFQD